MQKDKINLNFGKTIKKGLEKNRSFKSALYARIRIE